MIKIINKEESKIKKHIWYKSSVIRKLIFMNDSYSM